MVRKTKEETEKTRLSLLHAALDVFSTKGFVRSTLNDIAQQAGVSRGAIYWHFKDKVDLFEALSDYIEQRSNTQRDTFLQQAFSSLEDIAERIMGWLKNLDEDETFRRFYEFVNFKLEYHEELDGVLTKERRVKREVLERFVKDYTRMQQAGEIRKDIQPKQAALMTMFFVHGLVEMWLFDHDLFSIKEDVPDMIQEFLQSLK